MKIFLIIIIILFYSLQTFFCTLFNKKYTGREDLASSIFCIFESAFIVIFTFLWMAFNINASSEGFTTEWIGFHFSPSLFTVFIGVLNGVVLFGYNTAMIKASTKGSYAFMSVSLLFGGILIPAVFEMFSGSKLEFHHYIAIVIMLLSFILMNYKDIKLKGTPLLYYVYCIILFVCNGLYGVFLKIQSTHSENESNEMIAITFGVMGILALIQLLIKEKKQSIYAFKINKSSILPLVLCLLIAGSAINIYMLLIPLLGNIVTILYTIDNGGVLILSAIFSVVFFKERIDKTKLLGIILATISIVALAIDSESINIILNML